MIHLQGWTLVQHRWWCKEASLSNDTTSPRVIKNTRYVHQQVTCSNIHMPSTMEVKEPLKDQQAIDSTNNNITNKFWPVIPPCALPMPRVKSQKVNVLLIGSKRSSAKNASRKRIHQKLINIQNASNQILKLGTSIEKSHAKLHNKILCPSSCSKSKKFPHYCQCQ